MIGTRPTQPNVGFSHPIALTQRATSCIACLDIATSCAAFVCCACESERARRDRRWLSEGTTRPSLRISTPHTARCVAAVPRLVATGRLRRDRPSFGGDGAPDPSAPRRATAATNSSIFAPPLRRQTTARCVATVPLLSWRRGACVAISFRAEPRDPRDYHRNETPRDSIPRAPRADRSRRRRPQGCGPRARACP